METWEVAYLRKVIAETGMSGNALAATAKVSPSTINRPLNDPTYLGRVSPATLDKVARATGIDYRPFATAGFPSAGSVQQEPQIDKPGEVHLSIEGNVAHIVATVTLEMIDDLRRKIDLLEQFLKH